MLFKNNIVEAFNKDSVSTNADFSFSSKNDHALEIDSMYTIVKNNNKNRNLFFTKVTSGESISSPFSTKELGEITISETEKITNRIFSSFANDDIEFGNDSKTQKLIETLLMSYPIDFIDNVLLNVFAKKIVISKPGHMCKFMMLLSAFEAEEFPSVCNVAIAALINKKYNSVKEAVLIAIESWRYKDAIHILEDAEPYSRQYLEDYKQKIIRFLKGC